MSVFVGLECEDCGDTDGHVRRRRCRQCGLLVCGWCFHHVHQLSIQQSTLCPTQRPAMVSAPVNRYGHDR